MAVAAEIEPYEGDEDDSSDLGLTDRQVQALEWLEQHDAAPAEVDPETGKSIYDSNAQVRAYQMIAEGRFGGPGRGQGRKAQKRAGEEVAEHVRSKLTPKIKRAIERGLEADSERVAVDTAMKALEIERKERELQLQEAKVEADLDSQSKEDLIDALIVLAQDPQLEAAVKEGFDVDLPESEVAEVDVTDDISDATVVGGRSDGEDEAAHSPVAPVAAPRPDGRKARQNGRRRAGARREASANPFTQAALRRAAD